MLVPELRTLSCAPGLKWPKRVKTYLTSALKRGGVSSYFSKSNLAVLPLYNKKKMFLYGPLDPRATWFRIAAEFLVFSAMTRSKSYIASTPCR